MPYENGAFRRYEAVSIRFDARAKLYSKEAGFTAYKSKVERSIVDSLNRHAGEVAREVESEIARLLPPLVTVKAQVGFEQGSITLAGIIVIIGALSLIRDAIEIISMSEEIIRLIVERIAQQWIYEHELASEYVVNIDTKVEIYYPRISPQLSSSTAYRRIDAERLTYFVILNFLASVLVLCFLFDQYYFDKLVAVLKSIGLGGP